MPHAEEDSVDAESRRRWQFLLLGATMLAFGIYFVFFFRPSKRGFTLAQRGSVMALGHKGVVMSTKMDCRSCHAP